jgi:hypothetical protein
MPFRLNMKKHFNQYNEISGTDGQRATVNANRLVYRMETSYVNGCTKSVIPGTHNIYMESSAMGAPQQEESQ